ERTLPHRQGFAGLAHPGLLGYSWIGGRSRPAKGIMLRYGPYRARLAEPGPGGRTPVNFDAYTDLSVVTAVDLVNTLDVETGKDFLTEPEHLAKFLDDHLDSYARPLTRSDVTEVQGLRER